MRPVASLGELPHCETRAVIINCGTKWVTTLALLSVLRHARCPTVLIDCESRDGSREHFGALARAQHVAFDWLEWPLRPHPATLDRVFDEIRSEETLLVDSDLEILGPAIVDALRIALHADANAYGAGFLHGPTWMGAERGLHEHAGYYVERMWIPFTLLRTQLVRRARERGHSFATARPFIDLPRHPRLARLLGYRYRVRGLKRLRLPFPQSDLPALPSAANVPNEPRPSFVEFDTGALLHLALRAQGHRFAALPDDKWGEVRHYHGVTRAALTNRLRRAIEAIRLATPDALTPERSIDTEVKRRLADRYGVRAP
jgi:hypothetical protein